VPAAENEFMRMTECVASPGLVTTVGPSRFSLDVRRGGELSVSDWPSAAAASGLRMYVQQSREFLSCWMNTIGKARNAEPVLIVVKDAGRNPVLWLPLAIERKLHIKLLRFMDAGVADLNAPIVAPGHELTPEEFKSIWSRILARLPRIDAIDLQKIPSHVAGAVNPLTHLDCRPFGSSDHSILLRGQRRDAASGNSPNQRRNLRKGLKHLQEIGPVAFVDDPPAAQSKRIFARLTELKRIRYAATAAEDFLARPGIDLFYREMAAPGHGGGIGRLSTLTCGGEVVAAHLGFAGHDRFYATLAAYDPAYARFSVGHLLLRHLIERSAGQGFEVFDLGEGDGAYKSNWATHRLPLSVHERALTPSGLLYLQARRARQVMRARVAHASAS
jgi:CelD/BcsL family acetyltransferase involved in cellulose biosynthesis